jgi:hypothetical protein
MTLIVRYEGKHVTLLSGNDMEEYTVSVLFIVERKIEICHWNSMKIIKVENALMVVYWANNTRKRLLCNVGVGIPVYGWIKQGYQRWR